MQTTLTPHTCPTPKSPETHQSQKPSLTSQDSEFVKQPVDSDVYESNSVLPNTANSSNMKPKPVILH